MAILTSYSDKKFLILDDMSEMRNLLRTQIGTLGCDKVAVSANVRDALGELKNKNFDVILCDYNLGPSTDGQQFLEYLRSRNIISRATLFIMITAEKTYEKVVTAAECMPDDYLLKPFTANTLQAHLERLLEKKARLAKVDALQDQKQWAEVVKACDEIIASKDRYLVDAMRIRGNALIASGRNTEAAEFYNQALAMRSMPWAKLGLARAQFAQTDIEACKETLNSLIAETPKFLSAYDLLGRAHLESGQGEEALKVLDKACEVAPNSLSRHRTIAKVAEGQANFARVEQAMSHVVKRTKTSPLRETADLARLGNAMTELGEPDKAIALLTEARATYKDDENDPHLAAIEALAQHKAGRPALAEQALARALVKEAVALPQEVAMSIAKACLATGQQEKGESILKGIVQSTPDSTLVHSLVAGVMQAHGAGERAQALIEEGVREVITLNNEAVRRGKAGELGEAARMLAEAAHRLPANIQIVSNAAYALLIDVYSNGLDSAKIREASQFEQDVIALNPLYPKLADIAAMRRNIGNKYGDSAMTGKTP